MPGVPLKIDKCGTAEALLEALAPHQSAWLPETVSSTYGEEWLWIFRGQYDSTRHLVPSFLRRSLGTCGDFGLASRGENREFEDNRLEQLIKSFGRWLDASGIAAPRGPGITRDQMFLAGRRWDLPLMALAQHHRIPTILLDWTMRASVAAYFAAEDGAQELRKKGEKLAEEISVWALLVRRWPQGLPGSVELMRAERASNPNLHAQSGVFTILDGKDVPPSLNTYVESHGAGTRCFRRFDLPIAEAPKLLRLLSYDGVGAATMFPGIDGVVRSMKESQFWDRPELLVDERTVAPLAPPMTVSAPPIQTGGHDAAPGILDG